MKTTVTSLIAALIGFMIAHALQSQPVAPAQERIVVHERAPVVDTTSAVRETIRAELHASEPAPPAEHTTANEDARREGERIVQSALAAKRWTDTDRRALRAKAVQLASVDDVLELIRPIIVAGNADELAIDGPL